MIDRLSGDSLCSPPLASVAPSSHLTLGQHAIALCLVELVDTGQMLLHVVLSSKPRPTTWSKWTRNFSSRLVDLNMPLEISRMGRCVRTLGADESENVLRHVPAAWLGCQTRDRLACYCRLGETQKAYVRSLDELKDMPHSLHPCDCSAEPDA